MIRDANYNDIKSIYDLESANFSFPHSIEQIKLKDNSNELIVYDIGKVVGYISMTHVIDEGYINNIAVDKNYRKQGIGNLLIKEIINKGRELNLKFISLEVRKSNLEAINLYLKNGFNREGLIKNYYSRPTEDALIYTMRDL